MVDEVGDRRVGRTKWRRRRFWRRRTGRRMDKTIERTGSD